MTFGLLFHFVINSFFIFFAVALPIELMFKVFKRIQLLLELEKVKTLLSAKGLV